MQELIAQLQHAPDGARVAVGLASLIGLVLGFIGLRRYRLIEDVPTARIRSAPQGYVELVGRTDLLPGEPVIAPLSGTPCCWYRYRIERRIHDRQGWRTVRAGTSDDLFLLRYETGECVIDAEGATIDTLHAQTWYGHAGNRGQPVVWRAEHALGRTAQMIGGLLGGLGAMGSDHRYREEVILPGDPLYVIGWFHSLDDSDWAESEHERTRELLREWKARPDTLRERFDHDRNGIIDQDEWEDARRAARRRAREELAEARTHAHVHMVSRPQGRQYLIANRPESDLVRRYRWQAWLGLGAFLIGLGVLGVMLGGS